MDWAGLGSDVGCVRIVLASMDVELAVCMQHLHEDQCCKTISVDCNMNDTIFLLITSWLSIFAHTMRVPQATSLNELAVPGPVCTCCLKTHAGPASVGLLSLAACVFLHGVRVDSQLWANRRDSIIHIAFNTGLAAFLLQVLHAGRQHWQTV